MLIGLCGPACAGKRTVRDFLVSEYGFVTANSPEDLGSGVHVPVSDTHRQKLQNSTAPVPPPFLSQCWRDDVNGVIVDVLSGNFSLKSLLKRPYFLLIFVDAPLLIRFDRAVRLGRMSHGDLREFVAENDEKCFGNVNQHSGKFIDRVFDGRNSTGARFPTTALTTAKEECRLSIVNNKSDVEHFFDCLRKANITGQHRLRPGWDSYFMSLAELASERTNCMKRRVGCVIVRDKRLIATGYNGTPSNVQNCMDGGCARCNNGTSKQGVGLDLCLCLHAEENAIIEAGRERCEGSTLYTNLFPCILCAKVCCIAVRGILLWRRTPLTNGRIFFFVSHLTFRRSFSPACGESFFP